MRTAGFGNLSRLYIQRKRVKPPVEKMLEKPPEQVEVKKDG